MKKQKTLKKITLAINSRERKKITINQPKNQIKQKDCQV